MYKTSTCTDAQYLYRYLKCVQILDTFIQMLDFVQIISTFTNTWYLYPIHGTCTQYIVLVPNTWYKNNQNPS